MLLLRKCTNKHNFTWWKVYFNKFFRIIFLLIIAEGFIVCLVPYMGDGPVYKKAWEPLIGNWHKYWMTNFVYLNNLIPWQLFDSCLWYYYYFAVDFQLFWCVPPLIYVYCRNRKAWYWILISLIVIWCLYTLVLTAVYDISVSSSANRTISDNLLYSKPWALMGAYFVGCIFGLSYFELKNKHKYPELWNFVYLKLESSYLLTVIFFVLGIAITSSLVFPLQAYYVKCGDEDTKNWWPLWASIIYNTLARPLFAFALGLIIWPMFVRRFKLFKLLLSSRLMCVIGRLVVCIYTVQVPLMCWQLFDTRQSQYAYNVSQYFIAFGNMVSSILFSIPFSCIAELPFVNIQKYVIFYQNYDVLRDKRSEDSSLINRSETDIYPQFEHKKID